MPKRLKKAIRKLPIPPKPKRSADPNLAAKSILEEHMARVQGTPAADQMVLDPETVIREHMRKLGAKGGKISGSKRMENLSERQRKEIAKKAAAARWGRKDGGTRP